MSEPTIPISIASAKLQEITNVLLTSTLIRFVSLGNTVEDAYKFKGEIESDLKRHLDGEATRMLAEAPPEKLAEIRKDLEEAGFGMYL